MPRSCCWPSRMCAITAEHDCAPWMLKGGKLVCTASTFCPAVCTMQRLVRMAPRFPPAISTMQRLKLLSGHRCNVALLFTGEAEA